MAWPHCERSVAFTHGYFFFTHPPNQFFSLVFFFLLRTTSASAVSPVLSPTNITASSDTATCAAPVILSVWVLPPLAPTTPLTAALLTLSVLMGGGWFCYLVPLVHHLLHRLVIYVYLMGGGVFIPGPPHLPLNFLSMSVLVAL